MTTDWIDFLRLNIYEGTTKEDFRNLIEKHLPQERTYEQAFERGRQIGNKEGWKAGREDMKKRLPQESLPQEDKPTIFASGYEAGYKEGLLEAIDYISNNHREVDGEYYKKHFGFPSLYDNEKD